jgi:hypothetical protein
LEVKEVLISLNIDFELLVSGIAVDFGRDSAWTAWQWMDFFFGMFGFMMRLYFLVLRFTLNDFVSLQNLTTHSHINKCRNLYKREGTFPGLFNSNLKRKRIVRNFFSKIA